MTRFSKSYSLSTLGNVLALMMLLSFISCTPSGGSSSKDFGILGPGSETGSNSESTGTFDAIADITIPEATTSLTPALKCYDSKGSVPSYFISQSTPDYANCSIVTAGADKKIECSPPYVNDQVNHSTAITVRCNLDGSIHYRDFVVMVSNSNRPPVLSPISNQSVYTGYDIDQVVPVASDLDGDTLTYSCQFSGGGHAAGTNCTNLTGTSVAFDVTNGKLDWTTSSASSVAGAPTTYTITISASDGSASVSRTFTVTVNLGIKLTTIANRSIGTNNSISGGAAFSFNLNNEATSSDAGMTYACVYDTVVDAAVAAGTACTSLPGSASFGTATGIFSWTPLLYEEGFYEFKVTGTKAGLPTVSDIFSIEVKRGYVLSNLITELDAKYGNLTGAHPLGVAFNPWKDLQHVSSTTYDAIFASDVSQTWVGSGVKNDPYSLLFSPQPTWANSIDLGTSLAQDLNTSGKMMVSMWIKPSTDDLTGKVIMQNGGTGSGFKLEQKINRKLALSSFTQAAAAPSAFTGLLMWLKADAGITKDGSNYVSVWGDSGPGGNDAIQAGSTRPLWIDNALNGKPVIRFDGVDDYMMFPEQTTIRTAFFVIKHATGTSSDYDAILGHPTAITWLSEPGTSFLYVSAPNDIRGGSGWLNGVSKSPDTMLKPTDYSILSFTTLANTSAQWITRDRTNASRVWNGDYAEIILYDRVLTTSELRQVEAYLAEKYALPFGGDCLSSVPINPTWTHVAATINTTASTAKLYLDGVEKASCAFANFIDPSNHVYVGASNSLGDNAWSGNIGEVLVYSQGTPADVATNFEATKHRYLPAPALIDGGTLMWLRPDVGVTKTIGNKVTGWSDSGASGNNAFMASTASQPTYVPNALNGYPVIRFDGVDDFMEFPLLSTIRTAFFVVKHRTGTHSYDPLLGHSGTYDFYSTLGASVFDATYTATGILTGNTWVNNVLTAPLSIAKPTTYKVIAISSVANLSAQYITNDRNVPGRVWDGDYAEIILIDRVLTTEERASIETYLNAKYNLY